MAEVSGLDMVREIIGQINNLRRLVTINGKKFKWDGKKYVRAVDGKTFTKKELVSFVKDEKFTAPETPKARKGELKVDGKTVYKKRDVVGDLKSKAQGLKSRALKIKNKGNQVLQNAKLRVNPNPSEVTRRARSVNKRIGKRGVVAPIIDEVLNQTRLPDRASNFLSNMMFGQNMNLAQRDASTNTNLDALKSGKFKEDLKTARNLNKVTQGIENPEQTGGVIGRRIRPETPPNANTDTSKVTRENNPSQAKEKVKIKAGGLNTNAPDMGYDTKTSKKKKKKNNTLMIKGKAPSAIQKKLLKAGFTKDDIETLMDNHADWKKARGR